MFSFNEVPQSKHQIFTFQNLPTVNVLHLSSILKELMFHKQQAVANLFYFFLKISSLATF